MVNACLLPALLVPRFLVLISSSNRRNRCLCNLKPFGRIGGGKLSLLKIQEMRGLLQDASVDRRLLQPPWAIVLRMEQSVANLNLPTKSMCGGGLWLQSAWNRRSAHRIIGKIGRHEVLRWS